MLTLGPSSEPGGIARARDPGAFAGRCPRREAARRRSPSPRSRSWKAASYAAHRWVMHGFAHGPGTAATTRHPTASVGAQRPVPGLLLGRRRPPVLDRLARACAPLWWVGAGRAPPTAPPTCSSTSSTSTAACPIRLPRLSLFRLASATRTVSTTTRGAEPYGMLLPLTRTAALDAAARAPICWTAACAADGERRSPARRRGQRCATLAVVALHDDAGCVDHHAVGRSSGRRR